MQAQAECVNPNLLRALSITRPKARYLICKRRHSLGDVSIHDQLNNQSFVMGHTRNGARRGSLRSLPIKGPELHSPSVRKLTLHQSKFNGHIDEHLDMGRHIRFDLKFCWLMC